MAYKIDRKTHIIDATDQILGRLASQIAKLLTGKHKANFLPHVDNGDIVIVKNIEYLRFTGKNKLTQKKYFRHSGYPGGLSVTPLKKLWEEDKGEVLRRAVSKMLPKNKLRTQRIKRLHIK